MAMCPSDKSEPWQTLRERAEALMCATPADMPTMRTKDVQALVHELSVHQMELEIQNEELRQAQVELANSRDRLSDLYDFAPVGYLTLDRGGNIREANLTAAKILRTDRKRLMARPLTGFMTATAADLLYLHLMRVFESECKDVCQLQLCGPDELPCHVRLESVKAGMQDPPECRTIVSDVTELVQAQEIAQRTQRLAALGTLAAGIAHEINNPLWMISLQAEVALAANENHDREHVVAHCLQQIKKLVERGGRIVKSILCFSQQGTSEKWPYSLADVLARARDFTRYQAAQKQIFVELDASDHLPNVMLNPTEMEQVFVNLLTNAIYASQAGGHVRVAASCNAGLATVSVEDEGCGIASESRHRIFDPFYTTCRHHGGTGLGLNVAGRIVEDHSGVIEVASQIEKGTTVTVSLPLTVDQKTKGESHGNHLGR